jgi:hypothetical protein
MAERINQLTSIYVKEKEQTKEKCFSPTASQSTVISEPPSISKLQLRQQRMENLQVQLNRYNHSTEESEEKE